MVGWWAMHPAETAGRRMVENTPGLNPSAGGCSAAVYWTGNVTRYSAYACGDTMAGRIHGETAPPGPPGATRGFSQFPS